LRLNDVIFAHKQGVRETAAQSTSSTWAAEVAGQRSRWV